MPQCLKQIIYLHNNKNNYYPARHAGRVERPAGAGRAGWRDGGGLERGGPGNVNSDNNDNNYHFQGRRMFPALTPVHIQTFWTLCRFAMWLRKGVKPVRTKLNLATPRRPHGRDPAAES